MNRLTVVFLVFSFIHLVSCKNEQVDPEPDCSVSGLTLTLSEKTNVSCGASDGSATLTASGGEGTLTYSLADNSQESGFFEGLSAGSHTFTVTDENGCEETLMVNIDNTEGVTVTAVEVEDAGCGGSSGSISITATNGAEPYQYKLNDGPFQAENIFTAVAAGEHTIIVEDHEGCEFIKQIAVLSGISFNAHVSSVVTNNCAISGCHNGDNNAIPNFTNFSEIKRNASSIKSLTASGTMPKEGSITQQQIDMIACWVDDGALNN